MRPRGAAACPHRVHQRRLAGPTHTGQERRPTPGHEGRHRQGHRHRHGVSALEGRFPQGFDQ